MLLHTQIVKNTCQEYLFVYKINTRCMGGDQRVKPEHNDIPLTNRNVYANPVAALHHPQK